MYSVYGSELSPTSPLQYLGKPCVVYFWVSICNLLWFPASVHYLSCEPHGGNCCECRAFQLGRMRCSSPSQCCFTKAIYYIIWNVTDSWGKVRNCLMTLLIIHTELCFHVRHYLGTRCNTSKWVSQWYVIAGRLFDQKQTADPDGCVYVQFLFGIFWQTSTWMKGCRAVVIDTGIGFPTSTWSS